MYFYENDDLKEEAKQQRQIQAKSNVFLVILYIYTHIIHTHLYKLKKKIKENELILHFPFYVDSYIKFKRNIKKKNNLQFKK